MLYWASQRRVQIPIVLLKKHYERQIQKPLMQWPSQLSGQWVDDLNFEFYPSINAAFYGRRYMARYRSLQADKSQGVVLRIVRLQFHVYGRRTNKQENI